MSGHVAHNETENLTEESKRGLCIAARIIQTLANDGECDNNKPHLEKINRLITDNRPNIRKYIEGLSNRLVRISILCKLYVFSPNVPCHRCLLRKQHKMPQQLPWVANWH